MKIGIITHDLGTFKLETIDNFIAEVNKYGFSDIQLVLWKSFEDIDPYLNNLTDDKVKYISKKLKNSNINIIVLGAYYNMISLDNNERNIGEDRYLKSLELLKKFNGNVVASETGSYNSDFSFNEKNHSNEAYNIVYNAFKKFTKFSENINVNCALEPVYRLTIWNVDIVKKIIDDINSNNFKIVFDPVNIIDISNYEYQDEMIEKAFEYFGRKIETVHFKDFVINNNKLEVVSPGKGILNYSLLLKKMKEYGINGILDEIKKSDIEFSKQHIENIYNNL